MLDVTPQECILLAVISLVAAAVGAGYITRQLQRPKIAMPRASVLLRRPTPMSLFFPGAPCRFWLYATAFFGVMGFGDSLAHGHGLLVAIRNGLGIGLLFGFGSAFYGCPAAIVGGLFAAYVHRKRRRPPPSERIDFGPL